jgi:hypothetical protein
MSATPVLVGLEILYAELDPVGELDPAERDRLARDLLAQRTREAEEELAKTAHVRSFQADDWSWSSILIRVKAAADQRSRTTGTTVPPTLIVAAAELVDLLLEACAQANVRELDAAKFVNLPAVALAAVGEAWSHVAERVRE